MKKTTIKIGLFSDLHLQNSNKHYLKNSDGKSDLLSAAEKFLDTIASHEFDILIFAGDLTDEETLDPYVLEATNKAILGRIAKSTKAYILLEGNHCIVDGANKYSVLSSYRSIVPNSTHLVIEKEEDFIFEINDQTVYIRCVPYQGDYGKMRDQIVKPLEVNTADLNILVYHAATANALMDNGLPSAHGIMFESDDLNQYHIAFAGDFHRPQSFTIGETDVHYIGAPFPLTRGQDYSFLYRELTLDENKEVSIVDHVNRTARRIVDIDYKDIDKLDKIPDDSIVYINEVPTESRRVLEESIKDRFYSCKIKVKLADKDVIVSEDRQAKLQMHRQQNVSEMIESLLTNEEKAQSWVSEVIDKIM